MPRRFHTTVTALLVALSLATLAGCQVLPLLQGRSPADTEQRVLSRSQAQTIGHEGGAVEHRGFKLHVAPGALRGPALFEVAVLPAPAGGDSLYSSEVYYVTGPQEPPAGPMTVELPLSDELRRRLTQDGADAAERVAVMLGTYRHVPSAGAWKWDNLPLEASVDLAGGRITASLPEGATALAAAPGARGRLLPLHRPPASEYTTESGFKIFVTYHAFGWRWAKSARFALHYQGEVAGVRIDRELAGSVLEVLEANCDRLLAMGFSLGSYATTERPFEVCVEVLQADDGTDLAGQFSSGWFSPYIKLNPNVLLDPRQLTSTLGHELFHLAHYVAHPRIVEPYDTLDEAASLWYEAVAAGDERGYINPDLGLAYRGFFKQPLFFPPAGQERRMGYGAGYFLRYLVHRFGGVAGGGHDFVARAYAQPVEPSGARALSKAL
ncbi:MAG: hypothetical protein ACUVX9_00615 [Anaerolineae bacterium]